GSILSLGWIVGAFSRSGWAFFFSSCPQRHDFTFAAFNNAEDKFGPSRHRSRFLSTVQGRVVSPCCTGLVSNVTEDRFDDIWLNPNRIVHGGGCQPPKIVKTPSRHGRDDGALFGRSLSGGENPSVEVGLGADPIGKASCPATKYKIARRAVGVTQARSGLQNGDCRRTQNNFV